MNRARIISLTIVLLSFFLAFYFYPLMPPTVASHWGFSGEVNGYTSRAFGLYFMPVLLLVLFVVFLLIPKVDPLKQNIKKFSNYFDGFVISLFLFMLYIYLLTIIWNRGIHFNMSQMITPAFSFLFLYTGILIENAKRNWFIGIRTPWTMSSDYVWDKTHALGGKLFKFAAMIAIFGVLFPSIALLLVLAPIILFSLYLVAYSYIVFKKEKNKKRK